MGFHLKIAGVTYGDRQKTISQLKVGQELKLVREPNNPYDSKAIAVKTLDDKQVGYIPSLNNSQMAFNLDHGQRYKVTVSVITGGGIGLSYGCNIFIE